MANPPTQSRSPDRPIAPHVRPLRTLRGLLLIATAVCVGLAPGAIAHAAPTPQEIETQMDKQWEQLEPTIEEYNKVHSQLLVNRKKSDELKRKIQPLALQVDMALGRVGELASRYYRSGPSSTLNALLASGDPMMLTDQLTLLDRLAREEQQQITEVVAARDKFNAEKAKLDGLIAQQTKQDTELAGKRKQIDGEIKRLEQLRQAAYGSSTAGGALRKGPCPATYIGGPAGTAVKTACAQIGKPYVWASNGPNSFDCSGLTQFAWGKAGVSLTHHTGKQWTEGKVIPRAQARPGDLVFFYGDLHHMGMYVGNGLMVHAPRTGDFVKMSSIDVMPVVGFRRPG
ncbi:C40 family peptidase [Micromonospora sp. NBC_01699]|uniref:C40 family peptidase n=1 Tax=Micromonospora sp. NBC_01699 TaxID=2975984 RepID=UPI002E2A85A6|nr:NlpC/P60 family protein [Micromonospora sp. NBC_01699]